jgi:general stress protein 26
MAGRRDAIRMTDEEVGAFLEDARTMIAATNGHDGFPHLMPLWFVVRESGLWGWTYARSQKARNLERDPRATVQVEDGTRYEELRGVMLRCEVRLHRDPGVLEGLAMELLARYADPAPEDLAAARAAYASQIPKRVGLEFVETGRRVTWDHRKLAAV